MSYISERLARARNIVIGEGLSSLIKRALFHLGQYVFFTEEYYVREHYFADLKEADFLPRIKGLSVRIVSGNNNAVALAKEMGTDFRNYILNARRRLDRGAVAFCVFIEKELASIVWIGSNKRAKESINPQPYFIDFNNGAGCTGGGETIPKYRNMGLMAYACYHRNNFMKEHDIKMLIGIDATNNEAIYRVQSRFPSRLRARAHYMNILWWKYWKETPLPDGFIPQSFK
jgi:hypothetical protein